MLHIIFANELERRRISVRNAARQIGVAHTTLYRVLEGRNIDITTLTKVCTWMGVDTAGTVNIETRTNNDFITKLAVLLDQQHDLGIALSTLVALIEEGNLEVGVMGKIAEFITFCTTKHSRSERHEVRK